ncbi:ABC transporter substrate-binding protein [Desulfovibrio sp. JC022]|uniref:substrate-binding periplasmic protein n=1 Tax=Desulfovibrio sp. JC022 TaxID=2593642 RepID=UPI0013D5993C|nr:transporter substrate-binding domain-containing protein [Desulfovibrio sp. JC022]NDV22777.1 amino acid ABC transporter substrate-binding protein [Desulfovibrio sp. JC022]
MSRAVSILVLLIIVAFPTGSAARMEIKFATQDFFPFSYEENGEIKGPGAEIVREVCKKIDVKCSIGLYPWRRSLAMCNKGQIQALFMVGKNKERVQDFYFSPPLIATEYGFFECLDKPIKYEGITSLHNMTIGTYGPSNTSYSLEKLVIGPDNNINIDITPDDLTQFKKLARCRVDAVYSNKDVGLAIMKRLKIKNIAYAGTEKRLNYYIAFSKKSTPSVLVRKFNLCLSLMKQSGRLQQILQKYGLQAAD